MKTKRLFAAFVVVLLGTVAVMAKDIRVVLFKVSKIECENCERKIMNNMKFEKGVKDIATEVKTKQVTITYDADKTSVKSLQEGFKKFDYEAEFIKETKQSDQKPKK